MMDVPAEDVCRSLNINDALDLVSVRWEESAKHLPEDRPDFLNEEVVRQTCRDLDMDDDMTESIADAVKVMAADPSATRLAWHAYWLAFSGDHAKTTFSRWPAFEQSPPIPGTLFYVVVSLGAVKKVRRRHAERGIPRQEADEMLQRIVRIFARYKRRHGAYGFPLSSFSYFTRFFNGELFHLGRLQFHYNPFNGRLRAYRHVNEGTVIALSDDGIDYRSDGEFFIESRGDSPEGVWSSSFAESDDEATGHPITPIGRALPYRITLDKSKWARVLEPKDPVLQIHIPGSSPMDFDLCGDAFRQAEAFFTRYFSDRSYKAFAVSSWLADHQLEQMLPDGSNLVRFLREMYRFPTRGTTRSALRWIFGNPPPTDLTKAPRDTTLRRNVIDHVLSGGNMVGGGGFVLADELNWGSQKYRRQDMGEFGDLDGVTLVADRAS